ncbi:tetratricopeptide repeat protein [Amycolatopsis sp. NPDC003865]
MDAGRLTLQDLIKRRQAGGFVGRRQEIGRFDENLRLPLEDQRRRFLFSVHGDAGVGKSFLVNQFQRIAGEQGCATAYTDESVFDIPSVMSGIVRSFARQGDPCKEFTKKSELYHEKRHELDADPATPDGLSSVLTRSAVRIGLRAAEDIPVVGSFAKELDRDAISNQVEKFRAFLSVKLRNQHDVRLLMSPVEELTPIFVAELREVAAKRGVVLFFDTFERTGVFLERWLLDLLDGRYGSLPPNLVLVLAGQHPLDVHVWGDYLGIRADCPLEVFTEEEAREFLAARGITADEVAEVVLALSGRLPVLLALLAESRPDSAASVADPGDNAVERFLKWEKDEKRKQAALRGALPRQLDRDVFALVADAATPDEDFAWLRRLPFVTERATGYRYHDVVRDTMIRTLRRRSPAEWRERHGALAEYFRTACDALGLDEGARWQDERWQVPAVEEHYHRLCAGVTGAVASVLAALVETMWSRADQAGRWVAMIRQAGADSSSEQLTALGTRLTAATAADGDEAVVALLTCLTGEPVLPRTDRRTAYKQLIQLYLRRRDFPRVVDAFTALLEDRPDDRWALAGRGSVRRLIGEFEESLADLTRAVELDPASAWEIGQRGQTLHALERYEEALAEFGRSLDIDPGVADVHRARGETYLATKRYEEALAGFTRALEIEPDVVWTLWSRGRTNRAMERYEAALADFTRAIELETDADSVLAYRGEVYYAMERYAEALADFTRAIEMNPENGLALRRRGLTHEALGRYDEALADYTRCLEIHPDSVGVLERRAVAHRAAEHYAEAFADLARALELKPDAEWILGIRGEIHYRLGDYEQALADLTKAIELSPDYVWALDMRARTHRAMGNHAEALADFGRAVEIDPMADWVFVDRGETHHLMGSLTEALADYDRAIDVNPEFSWALTKRALTLRLLKREEDAVADLTRVLDIVPDSPERWRMRGELQHELGRYDEALADFTRAIDSDASMARAFCCRGRTHQSLKRYAEALADYDRALGIDPGFGWAASLRGQLYRRLGRFAEALPDLRRAVELDAEGWDHYQLGLLALAQGRASAAKELFSTAARAEDVEDGEEAALLNLMTYHLALGDEDQAQSRLEAALVLAPSVGDIRDVLEDLEDLATLMPVPERFATTLRAEL